LYCYTPIRSSQESEPEVKAVGSLEGHLSLEWLRLKSKGASDTEKAGVFIRELQDAEKRASSGQQRSGAG